MLSATKFLLLMALFLALAWWIGGLPGDVSAHAGSYVITTTTPAALLLLFLIALLFTVSLRVLGGVLRAPKSLASWRSARRAAAGEVAAQRGLVALAAGDAVAAKAAAGRAQTLLGDVPLVLMLRAEAAKLAGDVREAKIAFAKLAQHKEMRFLGHRGLLRLSLDEADHEAASRHAHNAEDAYPGAAWTREQRLALALNASDFKAALGLTREPRAVAALALAAAENATPQEALNLAKRALKAQPDFAPALAAAAGALRRLGKPRAARKLLVRGWKRRPHRLLAQAWLAPEAAALARAQDALALAAANPGHVETELLLAQTSLAAGLPAEAKRHAEAALHTGPNDGRAQEVLDALAGQPHPAQHPAWRCEACHGAAMEWAALCPVCGKLGTLAVA